MDHDSRSSLATRLEKSCADYIIVSEHNLAEARDIIASVSADLKAGRITLLAVIESLARFVNDDVQDVRARVINYLVAILANLPRNLLLRSQIKVLSLFLSDRILEGDAVQGFSILQGFERVDHETITCIFRSINRTFSDLQQFAQVRRHQVLRLLHCLFFKHRNTLQRLDREAIESVCNLVAGEKDPRNLMLVFDILHVLVAEWNIRTDIDVIFESIVCYFPITFRPPPDDPYGITAEQLKVKLRTCLAASSQLAPQVFPLLVERIDTASDPVKKDVLQTIHACISAYDSRIVTRFATAIYDAVKPEIFNITGSDLREQASLCAISLLKATTDLIPLNEDASRFVGLFRQEYNDTLKEPDHKQAAIFTKLVSEIAVALPKIGAIVISDIFPDLLQRTLHKAEELPRDKALLQIMSSILDSIHLHLGAPDRIGGAEQIQSSLIGMKVEILELCFKLLDHLELSGSMSDAIFPFFSCVFSLPRVFSDEEIRPIAKRLMTNSESGAFVGYQSFRVLRTISQYHIELALTFIIPTLLSQLPPTFELASSDSVTTILRNLALIAIPGEVSDLLKRRLWARISNLEDERSQFMYVSLMLRTLNNINSASPRLPISPVQEIEVSKLLDAVLQKPLDPLVGKTIRLLAPFEETMCRHVRKLSLGSQCAIFSKVNLPLCAADGVENARALGSDDLIAIQGICMFRSVLVSLSHEVLLKLPESITTNAQIQILLKLHRLSTDDAVHSLITSVIMLQLNKMMSLSDLKLAYRDLWKDISTSLKTPHDSLLLFAASKAMQYRGFNVENITTDLFALVDQENCPSHLLEQFSFLLQSDAVLNLDNSCVMRLLVPQRVLIVVNTMVRAGLEGTQWQRSGAFFEAVIRVMASCPVSLYIECISELGRLLIHCLDICRPESQHLTIKLITATISMNPEILREHLTSLVKGLVTVGIAFDSQNGSNFEASESKIVETQCKALHALADLPGCYSLDSLMMQKNAVKQGLSQCLGHRLREVRQAAARCKAIWQYLGE